MIFPFLMGIFVGFIIAICIAIIPIDIMISQETADDICKQLTGNDSTIAEDESNSKLYGGKLICLTPSYDETQNIIIKSNSE